MQSVCREAAVRPQESWISHCLRLYCKTIGEDKGRGWGWGWGWGGWWWWGWGWGWWIIFRTPHHPLIFVACLVCCMSLCVASCLGYAYWCTGWTSLNAANLCLLFPVQSCHKSTRVEPVKSFKILTLCQLPSHEFDRSTRKRTPRKLCVPVNWPHLIWLPNTCFIVAVMTMLAAGGMFGAPSSAQRKQPDVTLGLLSSRKRNVQFKVQQWSPA